MKLEEIKSIISDVKELISYKKVDFIEGDEYVNGAKDAMKLLEIKLGNRKLVSVKRLNAVLDELKDMLKEHEEKNDGCWVYFYCNGARAALLTFKNCIHDC